jgi:hypothetical protein
VLVLGFDAWVGHGSLSVPGILTLVIVLAIDVAGLILFSFVEKRCK